MSKSNKLTITAMTVLFGIAVYGFFSLKYPYHLHFQEQYQLFESTGDYFRSVAAVPGGFSDWLGRFLTQFFFFAPAGAAILAVLLCGVQVLTWTVCPRRTLPVYALTFLPAAALTAFYCDENALLGGAVALVLALGAAALSARIRPDRTRLLTEALLVPLLYLACGPLAVVFVLAALIQECARQGVRAWKGAVLLGSIAVLCPLVSVRIFPYPAERLVYGVHYFRYHNFLPGMLWAAAACAILVPAAAAIRPKKSLSPRAQLLSGTGIYLLVAALGAFLTFRSADPAKEEWMHYDFMARMEMWNRMMMTADRKNPDNPTTVSCLNLALAKTGRMGDHQFDYFQNGPEGLLPGFSRSSTGPVSTGEIYWHLGMVNTAQRFAFEAQEAIPDFQKSARCYKRLAQTNIVNGDWDVARKYLKALHNALFYRKWADETLSLLDSGEIFDRREDLARAQDLRLKEHDFLFSDTEMDSMLGLLYVEDPDNSLALDYLLSWCLLRKDLNRFAECVTLVTAPQLTKSCQEGLLLHWVLTHPDFNGLPPIIAPAHTRRISQFISDFQASRDESYMRRKYGDTYWFYYYYRYRAE